MSAILDLATRLEQAKGPDRELDFWIGVRLNGSANTDQEIQADIDDLGIDGMHIDAPFTASIDAAMSLVPDGPHGSHWGLNSHDRRNGKACAYVTLYDLPVGDDQSPTTCEAATPAIALCAAALRARHALEGGE